MAHHSFTIEISFQYCGCGGIGRRTRLRIWRRKAWGFDSLHPHHFEIKTTQHICGSSSVVEHHLAKVGVAGSNPVFRSHVAGVAELADAQDLKSCGR
jgi:hypothetical protein